MTSPADYRALRDSTFNDSALRRLVASNRPYQSEHGEYIVPLAEMLLETREEVGRLRKELTRLVHLVLVDDAAHVKGGTRRLDEAAVRAGRLLGLDLPELEKSWPFEERPEIRVHPLVLSRLAFKRKFWHPKPKRLARLRALYWWLVRRHETEICGRCGGPVRVVFHVPDAIWEAVAGYERTARYDDGEAAPGVLCVSCVDDLAEAAGLPYLRWTCATDDSVMVG